MTEVSTYRALVLNQEGGSFSAAIQQLKPEDFPAGEVTIRVAYSSLNYKDGLAITGKPGVIRKWPMVPGVDLAGTCLLYTSPSPRDRQKSRMPSSA